MTEYFDECPQWQACEWDEGGTPKLGADPALPRWAGKSEPPAKGTKIHVTMNSCGPAIVRGYFVATFSPWSATC